MSGASQAKATASGNAPASAAAKAATAKAAHAAAAAAARARALARARLLRRLDNLGRGALLASFLLLLPLVRNIAPQEQFLLPKRVMASGLMAVALLWWAWGLAARRQFRLNLTPVTGALAAFWAAHVLGWLVAHRAGSSVPLAADRLGWATLAFVFALLLQDFARGRRKYLLALAWGQILSAAITAAWVLHDDFFRQAGAVLRLPDWRGYLSAGLGNTGHIADWIALSFPAALLLLLRVRSRLPVALLIAHLGLGAAALIVCWSVHSNAGLIVALIFLLTCLLRRRPGLLRRNAPRLLALAGVWACIVLFYTIDAATWIRATAPALGLIAGGFVFQRRRPLPALVAVPVVALAAFFLLRQLPEPLHPHQPTIFAEAFGSDRWKEGGTTRLVIWGGTLAAIFERPILGWGAGNFTYAYPQARNLFIAPDDPLAGAVGQWTNAAHNVLLQTWAELGLAGLLTLAALVWLWFGAMRRTLGRGNPINDDLRLGATAMGLMGCVHAQMNFPLQLPSFLLFYAGLAALPLCLVDRNRRLRENRMEFEFDFRWIQFILRGEGMKKVRGVGFSLRLPMWGRVALFVAVAWLAFGMTLRAVRRFEASAFYRPAYDIIQHGAAGGPDVAEGLIAEALARDPRLVDAVADRAKLRYARGEWEGVVSDVDRAIPTLQAPKLYFWRAEARLRLGDADGAGGDLRLVLGRILPHLENEEIAAQATVWQRRIAASPPGRLFAAY